MLIKKSGLKDVLKGTNILLTGGGGGIGLEAGRAFAYLGAAVIIAEIDKAKGEAAKNLIEKETPGAVVEFYPVDLSDETGVRELCRLVSEKYGHVDVLFHNATVTPMGAVGEVPTRDWDKSYAVHLKAPLLMLEAFLPHMKKADRGVVVFVPSSGAAPYMGAYEVFKTSQVELSNTLAAELEGTGVYAYSIGPGLVKTETAMAAIEKVAARMGMSTEEFYRMNESHMLSAEEAGVGFALSVVDAKKYHGQEIGSVQALLNAGVLSEEDGGEPPEKELSAQDSEALRTLVKDAVDTYNEQYDGWMKRNVFERQWVLRDLKKTVNLSAQELRDALQNVRNGIEAGSPDGVLANKALFQKLIDYYDHQHQLLQGYEKNPQKLKENSAIILGWVHTLKEILKIIS